MCVCLLLPRVLRSLPGSLHFVSWASAPSCAVCFPTYPRPVSHGSCSLFRTSLCHGVCVCNAACAPLACLASKLISFLVTLDSRHCIPLVGTPLVRSVAPLVSSSIVGRTHIMLRLRLVLMDSSCDWCRFSFLILLCSPTFVLLEMLSFPLRPLDCYILLLNLGFQSHVNIIRVSKLPPSSCETCAVDSLMLPLNPFPS